MSTSSVKSRAKSRAIKSRAIPVRLSEQEFWLFERAAKLLGENRAEFIRAAAKARAVEAVKAFADADEVTCHE